MKEIYNGETVALGGVNLLTREVIVDDSTGERAKFTYDKTTGSITVLDEVDPDSVNPVTARAVAQAVAGASGEVPIIGDGDNGKVLKAVVSGGQKSAEWGEAAPAVTVDQVYNASSTNAQSGTAVAQAIASVPSPVVTENGSFKLGGSVPVKVNYTGSPGYERGSLRMVNTFIDGNYVVAMFEIVGSHNIYSETFGSATLTINEAMYIADTGNSTLTIAYSDSDSEFNFSRFCYRDSFTRTDGKIVPQSINFWNNTPYDTGSYIAVGLIPQYGPDADEKKAEVLQQLANGAVSISNWPVEEVMVTTVPDIPASTSADADKVLTVNSSGNPVWSAAQSGPSYTAGDGIEISNNKVAVRAGKNLDFANELVATQLYSPLYEYHGNWAWSVIGPLNMTRIVQLRQGMTIKMKASASLAMTGADGGAHFAICRKDSANGPDISGNVVLVADAALTTDTSHNFVMGAGDTYVADFSTLSSKSVGSFLDIDDDNVDKFYLTVISYSANTTVNNSRYIAGPIFDYPGDLVNTAEYYTENPAVKELVAVDQLPSYTSADSGKVLQVQPNGTLAWVTLS